MKFLIDFLPIVLFFIAYTFWGMFIATAVAIAAGVIQIAGVWLATRKIEKMHIITLILLVVLGGATLILKDPRFIMWKVTAVNWAFALAFVVSPLFGGKYLIQRMMGSAVELPGHVWAKLNHLWAGFFVFVGLLNLYFVRGAMDSRDAFFDPAGLDVKTDLKELTNEASCTEQFTGELVNLCQHALETEGTWVNFKLYGVLGLTFIFVIAQAIYLSKHIEPDVTNEEKPAD